MEKETRILNRKAISDADLYKEVSRISEAVVARYIRRSAIPWREREDVKMEIIEKFIDKKEQIVSSFEGKSKFTTYLTAVINRMCCEVIRKEQKHWYAFVDDTEHKLHQNEYTTSTETAKALLFREEVKRLTNTLLFFNGHSAKVNLFLKLYFNISVKSIDVELYNAEKVHDIMKLLSDIHSVSKTELFEIMARVQELAENKKVGGDAVRMWLNKQIDVVLKRLNNNDICKHNKESLAILFEMREHMQLTY